MSEMSDSNPRFDPNISERTPHSTDTNAAGELLPCPFCGGHAEAKQGYPIWEEQCRYSQFVVCATCGAMSGFFLLKRHATDKWNARASRHTPPSCEVDGRRKALEEAEFRFDSIVREYAGYLPDLERPFGPELHYLKRNDVLTRQASIADARKTFRAAMERVRQDLSSSAGGGGNAQAIDMILFCPRCGHQHIDEPDERTPDWTNPPHRSHLCHHCEFIWRPADIATNGVREIKTVGQKDMPYVGSVPFTPPGKDAQRAELKRMAEETIARLHLEHPNSDPRLQGLIIDEICALALLTLSRARSAGVMVRTKTMQTSDVVFTPYPAVQMIANGHSLALGKRLLPPSSPLSRRGKSDGDDKGLDYSWPHRRRDLAIYPNHTGALHR